MTTCVAVRPVRHIESIVHRPSPRITDDKSSVQSGETRVSADPTSTMNRPSAEYRKEMDKFIKNFVSRSAQVIVLSRAEGGTVYKTECTAFSSNQQWFLLNTHEDPQVSAKLHEIWNLCSTRTVPMGSAICLELTLVTHDNERMVLEIWEFALEQESDPTGKQVYDLYCRLIILQKSLISVSRIVPAFKLAYGQNNTTYRLHYELRIGNMQEDKCGEDSEIIEIGKVGMLHGTFKVSVRYRTKLTVGNKEKVRDEMTWQSNYFGKTDPTCENFIERCEDLEPNCELPRNGKSNKPLNEFTPYGAFADKTDHVQERQIDLSDMFSDLLLDADEMIPSQIEEKSYHEEDDTEREEEDLYDMTPQPDNFLKDKIVFDTLPAFVDCAMDLNFFFSGAPPVLKSLQADAFGAKDFEDGEQNTLERQMEKMNNQLKTYDDTFFWGVLNESDQQ